MPENTLDKDRQQIGEADVERLKHFFDDLTSDHAGAVAVMWDVDGTVTSTVHGPAGELIQVLNMIHMRVTETAQESD